MSDWRADKRITDPYMPHAKRICAEFLLREGTEEEDATENTDLRTFVTGDTRIGVRLRRSFLLTRHPEYADQFTIRWERQYYSTEFEKIIKGWGDYFLYGWMADPAGRPLIVHWTLIDLAQFRRWACDYQEAFGDWPGVVIPNKDNSSTFRAFNLVGYNPVPAGLTVAHEPCQTLPQRRPAVSLPKPKRFVAEASGQVVFYM